MNTTQCQHLDEENGYYCSGCEGEWDTLDEVKKHLAAEQEQAA